MNRGVEALGGVLARWLAGTWRLDVVGDAGVACLRDSGIPVVFTVWHALLIPPLWHRRDEGITLLVSEHADGGYLARAAGRWGYEVVRGSSTRGAVKGTLGIVRVLRSGRDVAITPDGPTGPPRVAKPGAVAVAARAGAAIVPIGSGASSWWRVGSWDDFSVPRPFSRVRIVYGEPLRPARYRNSQQSDRVNELAQRLDEATDSALC